MVSAGKVSAAPSLDYFKVAPANLAGPGWSTISWSVTGALYCEMWTTDSAWLSTGVGHPVPGLGSGAIPVNVTTTYILACTDGAVALNWSATIYVTAPPPIAGSCSPTHYNCSAGSLDNYFEYSNRWEWTCRGLNGGATSPICVEMKPQCSDGADNDSDGKVDMADPGCSSSSDTDETNAPLVAPTGLRVEVDPSNENRITISWDSMPGAEYYSLRVDNTSTFTISDPSKWRYGSGQKHDDCNYDSASDGNILADSVFVAPLGAGVDYCGNVDKTTTSITLYGGVLASSYNHIWIHSRDSSNAFSPASEIFVTLDPPSPTIITATCDASGNTTVSWNAVSVPGGSDRHYSFRLDNQADSWQYDFNNFRTNHDDCVFDNATDANGVLSRPSGSGTDYCGNMRNTSWTGVINPSGTQKAWIHTKSRDFLTFGDRPPSQVTFTCSALPITQCSDGADNDSDGKIDYGGGPSNDPGCSSASDTDETNAPTGSCIGTTPSNASLCTGDDTGLTADTSRTPVTSCTVPTKCEYECSTGYTPSGSDCISTGIPFASIKVNNQDTVYPAPLVISGGTPVTVSWTSWGRPYCLTDVYDFSTHSFYPGTTGTAPTFIAPTPSTQYGGLEITACGTVNYGTDSIAFNNFLNDSNSKVDMQFISIPAMTPTGCSASIESGCILPASANGATAGSCSISDGKTCSYNCNNGTWTMVTNSCTAPTAEPELKATPRLVSYGGSGTLTWDTHGTNEAGCSITGGSLGNSYASLPASGDPFTGSLPTQLIYGKTTYVITCGTEFSTATFEVPSKGFET